MKHINLKSLSLRVGAVAALLAASVNAAHAVGFGEVDIGAPVMSNAVYAVGAPVAAISVRGGHGGYHGGYYRGGYYRGGGWGWGVGLGLGLGIGLGVPLLLQEPVYVQPSTVIIEQQPPQTVVIPPRQPTRPDPVIYPRSGQSAQQLEADRQECNRWATTQPSALTDSAIFMRALDACMDGRGYTTK